MDADLLEQMAQIEDHHWWFVARRRIVHAVLDRLELPASTRILDVGAGTGGTTRTLTQYGTVQALEIDPIARKHLEKTGLPVHPNPLPDPALPTGSYDLITAFDVLEHVPDDVSVTQDIHRLLIPGGWFLATVPAHPWLFSAHDVRHHHQRRYTREALRTTLEGAGLQIVQLSPWLTLLFPLLLADRALQAFRGPAAEVAQPNSLGNRLLARITATERRWIAAGRSAPMGGSWIVLARRP
jgi:2-polyprenyl-3-methyl-5-hydroxy-6-metoxy-1,4-benzoquinol methylase